MLELVDLLSNTFNWRLGELAAELAAANTKVAELESKIESDPLLDILNRRGFERELKRALGYAQRDAAVAGTSLQAGGLGLTVATPLSHGAI